MRSIIEVPKKVLFILRLPPPFGGGEIVSKLLFEKLKDTSSYYFHLVKRRGHTKSKQSKFSLVKIFYGIEYIFQAIYNIVKFKPDIIFIGLPKSFAAFFRNSIIIHFAYLIKKTIYAELHGMSFPFLGKRKNNHYYQKTINKISKIRVLSSSISEYLLSTGYNGETYVIDNAVEIPQNIKQKDKHSISQPINLLYLGAISSSKGFTECLRLLKSFSETNINVNLNVIGEWVSKEFRNDCSIYINKNNIKDNITFHGLIIDEQKWDYINRNDFIIYLTNFDGQPLALIETLALGIPAFTKDVGAIGEMIQHKYNGFLVTNLKQIIDYIEGFLQNKYNYETISHNAIITYKNRFAPDIMIKNIKAMINNKF